MADPDKPEAKSEGSVEIFCSYSHKDETLRKEFDSAVALLRRQNLVQIWNDRKIETGGDWAGDIDSHLNSADIITLFVSSDFLASDYCFDKELTRALERQKNGDAVLVPIIVRDCDWSDAPFARLQAIPEGAKPVTSWTNRDEAWTDVSKKLKATVRVVLTKKWSALSKETNKPLGAGAPGKAASFGINAAVRSPEANRRLQLLADMEARISLIDAEIGPAEISK